MSKRSSEAQARAAADRAYLEQVRGDPAVIDGGQPLAADRPPAAGAALPTPATPAPLEQTEVMPHVPTAAPSPVLGVSPILGEAGGPECAAGGVVPHAGRRPAGSGISQSDRPPQQR